MRFKFSELINIAAVQRLTDLFYTATGISAFVLEIDGTILTGSGWQELCTNFHRVNPDTEQRCIESDTVIGNRIAAGQNYTVYKCKNGLLDAATPIRVAGEHVANLYTGQFFFESPDIGYFEQQARRFGFDENAYIEAVRKIPIIEETKIQPFLEYLSEIAAMLGDLGYKQLKQMEATEALRTSEERMKKAQEIAHLGSWELDLINDRLSWSDEVYRIFGLQPQEFAATYEAFLDAVHLDDRSAVDQAYSDSLREGRDAYEIEHRVTRKSSGEVRFVHEKCEHIRDKTGRIIMSIGMVHDITARKLMEENLRESRNRLSMVLSSITDAYLSYDNDWRLQAVNPEGERLIGLAAEEVIGKRPWEVYLRFDESEIFHHYRAAKTDGKPVHFEAQAPFTGEWYEAHVYPTPDGLEVYLKNINKRKRAEQALQKANEDLEQRVLERTAELQNAYEKLKRETAEREQLEAQLRQSQKMEALGTLSGGIAHDFNNILAAIIGFTELLIDHAQKGSRDERHLKRILEGSLRGRDLVRQMLTFSRKTEQQKRPLRLSTIVAETIELMRPSAPATISVKVNTVSESGVILGDPTQIQQVAMNLCANGIFSMQEKGGVLDVELSDYSVSASAGGHGDIPPGIYMRLVVRDTGTGISPEIVDRVFDPFFTTKKPGQGTGLGLSVVHGIVKQSNGYITVESEPGKGSAFTVYFPKVAEKRLTDVADNDRLPTGDEHILFVDDEEALVEMGEELLSELGYQVTSRTSSMEALLLLKQNPWRFDLIVTDQTMPEMTGIELAKESLAVRPDMPIIMCTGFSYLVDADTAKEAGIKGFVMKPLTKKQIAVAVRKALDERRMVG